MKVKVADHELEKPVIKCPEGFEKDVLDVLWEVISLSDKEIMDFNDLEIVHRFLQVFAASEFTLETPVTSLKKVGNGDLRAPGSVIVHEIPTDKEASITFKLLYEVISKTWTKRQKNRENGPLQSKNSFFIVVATSHCYSVAKLLTSEYVTLSVAEEFSRSITSCTDISMKTNLKAIGDSVPRVEGISNQKPKQTVKPIPTLRPPFPILKMTKKEPTLSIRNIELEITLTEIRIYDHNCMESEILSGDFFLLQHLHHEVPKKSESISLIEVEREEASDTSVFKIIENKSPTKLSLCLNLRFSFGNPQELMIFLDHSRRGTLFELYSPEISFRRGYFILKLDETAFQSQESVIKTDLHMINPPNCVWESEIVEEKRAEICIRVVVKRLDTRVQTEANNDEKRTKSMNRIALERENVSSKKLLSKIAKIREERRKDLISRTLSMRSTLRSDFTSHFGLTHLFEIKYGNPYQLAMELSIVCNNKSCRQCEDYREYLHVCSALSRKPEEDVGFSTDRLIVSANSTISLPFLYRNLDIESARRRSVTTEDFSLSILDKGNNMLASCQFEIKQAVPSYNASFRFYSETNSVMCRMMAQTKGKFYTYVHGNEVAIREPLAREKNSDIIQLEVTRLSEAENADVYVIFFETAEKVLVSELWRLDIFFVKKTTITYSPFHESYSQITIQSDQMGRSKCFSPNKDLSFEPEIIEIGNISDVKVIYKPIESIPVVAQTKRILFEVSRPGESNLLFVAEILTKDIKDSVVFQINKNKSKSVEIRKRISYSNSSEKKREFEVVSSDLEKLKIKTTHLSLKGLESGFIQVSLMREEIDSLDTLRVFIRGKIEIYYEFC